MRPLDSKSAYACLRASGVETSASGDTAPSLGRKTGSVPQLAGSAAAHVPGAVRHLGSVTSSGCEKRHWRLAGVIVHASVGAWQWTHARPFVPSETKNG